MARIRPPVPTWPAGGGFGFRAADSTRYCAVALTVLKVPIVSISMTDLKPFGDSPEREATKLPAAPALYHGVSTGKKGVGIRCSEGERT